MTQRDINKPVNILFEELKILSKSIPKVEVVDLHNFFLDNWLDKHKKFNFDYDYHWNEHGHTVAAQAIQGKINNMKLKNSISN